MTIILHSGDFPSGLSFGTCVAVDTETTGLDLQRDRLCLVQLSSGDGTAHLVRFAKGATYDAPNLKGLLTDTKVVKLFHFARADLAILAHHLGVMPEPRNVYCTKIASALTRRHAAPDQHGLKDLCKELLGIELAKDLQTSDWGAQTLTSEQLNYAASDVLYLHRLKDRLDTKLAEGGVAEEARAAMDFLPVLASLDIKGLRGDLFAYHPGATPTP